MQTNMFSRKRSKNGTKQHRLGYDICELTTRFQTNFLSHYLWIYTLRAYLPNQVT
jgi:hypothetical protein